METIPEGTDENNSRKSSPSPSLDQPNDTSASSEDVNRLWIEAGLRAQKLLQFQDTASTPTILDTDDRATITMLTFASAYHKLIISRPKPAAQRNTWCIRCIPSPQTIDLFQFQQIVTDSAEYDPSNTLHFQMICNVWKRLTGDRLAPDSVGQHWESIGFQGPDPCADLNRSHGLLNLLFLLHLAQEWSVTAQEFFRLSQTPGAEFPYACVSIALGLIAITRFQQGLIKPHGKDKSYTIGVARCHVALVKDFMHSWVSKSLTIDDFDTLMNELHGACDTSQKVEKLMRSHLDSTGIRKA